MDTKKKAEKQVYVFIDTNIYLEYFKMSSATIRSLEELSNLLKEEKFKLILPKQVRDEYWRNKQKIINEMKESLKKQVDQIRPKLPAPVKDLPEAKEVRENYEKLGVSLKRLLIRYESKSRDATRIERLIDDIFKKSEFVEDDEKLTKSAYYRYLKGNPPGKDESYGDAIMWEILVNKFTDGDLFIITDDVDWYIEKEKKNLNELLIKEWKGLTKNKILIYSSLAEFINKFTKKAKIKKEIVEEEKANKNYLVAKSGTPLVSGLNSTVTISPAPQSYIISGRTGSDLLVGNNNITVSGSVFNGYCSTCSHFNEQGARFCSRCGNSFS